MDVNSTISVFRNELKSELSRGEKDENRREKSKKTDFLLWRGYLLHGENLIPKDTSSENPIVALGSGNSEKGALHLPHTAKPPKIGKYASIDQDTQLCRLCCGTLYDISRTVHYLTQIEAVATYAAREVKEY